MIIIKLTYLNGKLEPKACDAIMSILPYIVEHLWPEEYRFDNVEVIDSGYSYYKMEDTILVIGEPNMGQRFIGEKFVYPETGNKGVIIEYYAYEKNDKVMNYLVQHVDRLTLF